MPKSVEKVKTTAEAAKALGVVASTVVEWVHKGFFGTVQKTPGGHIRIPEKAVEEMKDRMEYSGDDGNGGGGG